MPRTVWNTNGANSQGASAGTPGNREFSTSARSGQTTWAGFCFPSINADTETDDDCNIVYPQQSSFPEFFFNQIRHDTSDLENVCASFDTIREGIRSRDYFGYASSVGADGRYRGLQFGSVSASIYLDDQSVLVKPDAAAKQLEAEAAVPTTGYATPEPVAGVPIRNGAAAPTATLVAPSVAVRPRRLDGSVELDPTRVARDVGQIAQEVIQHLTRLVGADVKVTMEVHATIPEGAPD